MIFLFWTGIIILTLLAIIVIALPLLPTRLFLSIVIILPALSLPLYLHWGSSMQLEKTWRLQQETQLFLSKINHHPQQVILGLQKYLAMHPQSVAGWYLLGRLYAREGKLSLAESAFKNARNYAQ